MVTGLLRPTSMTMPSHPVLPRPARPGHGHSPLRRLLAVALVAAAPMSAQAWWDAAYKQRTVVTLNTGAEGLPLKEAVTGAAMPVRLHSGNFDFVGARPDGSDLRVLAADDKTPLQFSIEKFDGTAEMAVLWVQVPTLAPGSDKNQLHVYAGNPQAPAAAAAPVVDPGAALTLRFAEVDGLARDAGGAAIAAAAAVPLEANGLIGASARFDGSNVIDVPASDRLQAAAGAPYAVSLWARPAGAGGTLLAQGPLALALDGGKLVLRLGALRIEGGSLPPGAWAHVGATLGGGKATLYVNGVPAAQADLPAAAPAIGGALQLGRGYAGLVDEVQVAPAARSAEWMAFTRAAQGADAKLIATQTQAEGQAEAGEGGSHNYFGILFKNLTVDAWVVIGICGVMFLVACWVMVSKTLQVRRTDRGNRSFLQAFRSAPDVLQVGTPQAFPGSSLARLYAVGVQQLQHRRIGQPGTPPLSGLSLNAVTASVNADLVRENQGLNGLMVLLTIAISGGPFLGLLGTVVGVMITFAAIAAAGDVNVNAIAPGIAAALLATVAGLGVAIPSLFGYNYLAARIKNISADMQIFIDEFISRVAEQYGEHGGPGTAAPGAVAAAGGD
jgi:biopolymer transport protein ExbB